MHTAVTDQYQPRWKRGSLSIATRLLLVAACVVLVASTRRYVFNADSPDRWLQVASDSSYTISIDRTRVRERWSGIYEVWYRTDHATTHLYKGASFNREVVESLLRCNTLQFKILSVDMSMRGGRTVSRQRTDDDDIRRQPWRSVEPGSIEADAAKGTCEKVHGFVRLR